MNIIRFSLLATSLCFCLQGQTDAACTDTVYVGGYEADSQFESIPDACLAKIRDVMVLFGSRSYGQNMLDGVERYGWQDSKYVISQEQYDVRTGGPSAVPADAFQLSNIVHELCIIDGYERVDEFAGLVGRFKDDMTIGMLEAWPGWPNTSDPIGSLDKYGRVMDSLRTTYPDIDFVYHTRHLSSAPEDFSAEASRNSGIYRDSLFARYRGVVPIYDFYDIMSTRAVSPSSSRPCVRYADGTYNYADCVCTNTSSGDTLRMCCPEYDNGINGHPSVDIAELRFGRSLYVLWSKLVCDSCGNTPPDTAGGLSIPEENRQSTGLVSLNTNPLRAGSRGRFYLPAAARASMALYRVADTKKTELIRNRHMSGGIFSVLLPGDGAYVLEYSVDGKTDYGRIVIID